MDKKRDGKLVTEEERGRDDQDEVKRNYQHATLCNERQRSTTIVGERKRSQRHGNERQ